MLLNAKTAGWADKDGRKEVQGKEVEALWDTGSQVCVVSRKWQQSNLPVEVLRNIEELLGIGEELNLDAMNGTDIPFDGWI